LHWVTLHDVGAVLGVVHAQYKSNTMSGGRDVLVEGVVAASGDAKNRRHGATALGRHDGA
jgi:hypothetical protein